MLEITPALRKRFAKDYNLPVALFDEPYFTERLETINRLIPCLEQWKTFQEEIQPFHREQDYFEYYNQVKDKAITHLQDNKSFQRFVSEDFHKPSANPYPSMNIYSPVNNGKMYISLDMRKANFSALRHFDPDIFDGMGTWEGWLSQFTDMEHILHSKYIRQVVMGACNPKRQVGYEKELTIRLADAIRAAGLETKGLQIVCLSNDEIVYEVTDKLSLPMYVESIRNILAELHYSFFRMEAFVLWAMEQYSGYLKEPVPSVSGKKELKCVAAEDFHFAVKELLGIPVTDNDLVFRHNGRLAKYLV